MVRSRISKQPIKGLGRAIASGLFSLAAACGGSGSSDVPAQPSQSSQSRVYECSPSQFNYWMTSANGANDSVGADVNGNGVHDGMDLAQYLRSGKIQDNTLSEPASVGQFSAEFVNEGLKDIAENFLSLAIVDVGNGVLQLNYSRPTPSSARNATYSEISNRQGLETLSSAYCSER